MNIKSASSGLGSHVPVFTTCLCIYMSICILYIYIYTSISFFFCICIYIYMYIYICPSIYPYHVEVSLRYLILLVIIEAPRLSWCKRDPVQEKNSLESHPNPHEARPGCTRRCGSCSEPLPSAGLLKKKCQDVPLSPKEPFSLCKPWSKLLP